MTTLDWLPESCQQRIQTATQALKGALGEHLEAVVLVGAAVHPDRPDRAQAPELLVIGPHWSLEDLQNVATQLAPSMRHAVRVRLLTSEELRGSADVFGVEIAEYKLHHVGLHGSDPFAGVEIDKASMRRSVEQGLCGLGRQVRNRVLGQLAQAGSGRGSQAVVHGLNRLVVLSRHALPLLGAEVPNGDEASLAAVGTTLAVDSAAVCADLRVLREGGQLADPLKSVSTLLSFIEPLLQRIDGLDH